MEINSEILSIMDILEFDEEIVDSKLNSIMVRNKYSNKNLRDAISLLNYKYLVNIQEENECDNDTEFDFMVKLIKNANKDMIDNICKIIKIVLLLNKSKVVCNCEHLMQQLLADLSCTQETETSKDTLMTNMRICCSILEVLTQVGERISLLFLVTPLEKILDSADETLKTYFLTEMVPKLAQSAIDYNILDRIWNHIKNFEGPKKTETLKILSCLSDYYLPSLEGKGNIVFKSNITEKYELWKTILYGLETNDVFLRKITIYLTKRALETVFIQNKNIKVISECDTIFTWVAKSSNLFKNKWDNYFVLLESLEEQQSNIVLPSLKLFDVLKDFGHKWLNCAFNIGLKHENSQVRLKCIERRLQMDIIDLSEAQTLLESLNDVNIYELQDNKVIQSHIFEICRNHQSFLYIFKAIPNIKWSPIPLYHLSCVLSNLREDYSFLFDKLNVMQVLKDILKMPCNNVAMRNAVHVNLSHFIGNCMKCMNWKTYIDIYGLFRFPNEIINDNPFVSLLKYINIIDNDKIAFYEYITKSNKNIEIVVLYLQHHEHDINIFLEVLNKMILNVQTVITKQYSDKLSAYKDVLYLLELYTKTKNNNKIINNIISREMKTISQYILSLFCIEKALAIEDINKLYKTIDIAAIDEKEMLLEIYKTAVLFMKDDKTEVDKKILCIFTISSLHDAPVLRKHYKHELLDINSIVTNKIEFTNSDQSIGRLRNAYFEKTCEIIYKSLKDVSNVVELSDFIDLVIECGGYGCLKWILRIVNKLLPLLVKDKKFDIKIFLNRMWLEIGETKSNSQYNTCIKEFIVLLNQDVLLKEPDYNNVILAYCSKIIDLGLLKNAPLFYLTEELGQKQIESYGQLVYILCDILLYCPVLRRDQRVADCITQEILKNSKYGVKQDEIGIHFNYEIQYTSIAILSKIKDSETLEIIISFLLQKIDGMFKSKQRYHGNSQSHRTLLTVLQHLIIMLLLNWKRRSFKKFNDWCMEFLGRLPHQPSVKIVLMWYISLYYYIEKVEINEDILKILDSKKVPLISQFFIIFWLTKHKLLLASISDREYGFVMNTLLSHTMGQLFNIRLHAQYMASQLHKVNKNSISSKFDYIIKVIESTFKESENDKTLIKLKEDFFANHFDIVKDLNSSFVYYYLPRFCELWNEEDVDYAKNILNTINDGIVDNHDDLKIEWANSKKGFDDYAVMINNNVDNKLDESVDEIGTIQKKYIPWKNMSNVNFYEVSKKKETTGHLIIVASLIDKLPNLGGMARTSEVFGVNTYVVASLMHLHDRQFQGLSVSAERWINVEEVRPGRPLKEYLAKKKSEGYAVVAAEQTSTSCKLQSFKFPKKTLLLLGHEKEGIPSDLLPLMDHCVEIPQQGFVRSLNVHVTAAIFIWEYTRQNILA